MAHRHTQSIGMPLPGTYKSVAYTGAAGITAAIGDARKVNVRVSTDAHIAFGQAATTSDPKIYADMDYQFKIKPGSTISAIQVSSGGTLEIYELD